MWINNISEYMFNRCKLDDRKEFRDLITDDRWIYQYCKSIKDRPEMAKKMTSSIWIKNYYLYLKK